MVVLNNVMAYRVIGMAKKGSTGRDDGKCRLEIRFDSDVYTKIKGIADSAEISVNQLLHGIARWAAANAVIGEPYHDEAGRIQNRRQPGCVWLGKPSKYHPGGVGLNEHQEPEEYEGHWEKGNVIMSLDFTERRVVRKDI
jgi:hypothetical protein